MSWHLFEKVLEEVSKQATIVGKVWITLLFMFRIITLTRTAEGLYSDEQAAFRCNTRQPGCENMCFNAFSPVSHVRFWGFQTILTATPSIVFLIYATHTVARLQESKLRKQKNSIRRRKTAGDNIIKKKMVIISPVHHYNVSVDKSLYASKIRWEDEKEASFFQIKFHKENKPTPSGSAESSNSDTMIPKSVYWCACTDHQDVQRLRVARVAAKSSNETDITEENFIKETEETLTVAYKAQCVCRSILEIVFLILQCKIFGFEVPFKFDCSAFPCPNTVDCFVSRPDEKSAMLTYMFVVTTICIGLSVYEFFILTPRTILRKMKTLFRSLNVFARMDLESSGSVSCVSEDQKDPRRWFIDNIIARSDGESSSSSTDDDDDASIDSGELDAMYEQECEMEVEDYDAGNDGNDDFS